MVALSPFHLGEQAVQLKAGGPHMRDAVEQMGRRVVRDYMPEQHREFFGNQQLLYFAAQDPATGNLWASVLAGAPGFISSPNPKLLSIAGPAHVAGDPAAAGLEVGSRIGLLGLELTTRRRNRMNGTLVTPQQDGGLLIAVDQSFGNCPKYIQAREVELDPALLQHMSTQVPGVVQHGTGALGLEQAELVSAADTFFLATSSSPVGNSNSSAPYHESACQAVAQPESQLVDEGVPAFAAGLVPLPQKPAACGLDVSHRGGAPGFVVVSGDGNSLRWPDYTGNDMFNSFGNLALNPTAGLLFIDWPTGDTLQLTGTAAVHYDDTSLPGAKRTVVFEVTTWRHAHNALPVKKVTFLNASPHNPAVLQRTERPQGAAAAGEWLTCTDVRVEADGIKSYYFGASAAMRAATAAGKVPYQPGQYASFDFQLSQLTDQHNQAVSDNIAAPTTSASTASTGASNTSTAGQAAAAAAGSVVVNRTWTISSHPVDTAATGQFSITVKRAGLVSRYLWDKMRPGSRVLFRGVGGTFTLEGCTQRPLLLVAGGIGITPLRSMFQECIRQARPVTLIYSVSRAGEAAFLTELVEAAKTANAAVVKAIAAPAEVAAESGDTEGFAVAAVGPAYQVHLAVTRGAELLQLGTDGVAGHTGSPAAAPFPLVQHHQGRVTAAVLQQLVPDSAERCVFLCGPAAFMDAVTGILMGDLGHTREPETEAFTY